jgi:hypothetical protein
LANARWLALLALALLPAGCGSAGADAGATVSVYAAAPLCAQAEQGSGHAGDLVVRVVCLPPVQRGSKVDLARAGANARRATQDSTSIAYLEAPGPAAESSRSIVESAQIAWVETGSGSIAMRRIVKAIEKDGSSPRSAVLDEVG